MARDDKKDVIDYSISYFINKAESNLSNLVNKKIEYENQAERKIAENKRERKLQIAQGKLQKLKNTGGKWGKLVLSKEVLNHYTPKQREYIRNAIADLLIQNHMYYLDKDLNFRKYTVLANNNKVFFEVEEYDIVYVEDYVYIDDYGTSKNLKTQIAPRIVVIDSDVFKKHTYYNERGFTKEFLDEMLKGKITMEEYYHKKGNLTFEGEFSDLGSYINKISKLKDKCDLVCSYKDFTTYY